jgi:DNA polymerase delta subunit 1
VAGAEVAECGSERELLLAFADHLARADPDLVTGYNIYGFDMRYLHERAQELGVERELLARLGRRGDAPSRFSERRLASSALGDNVYWLIEMPGRVSVDLMKVVMREHRLESYRLDDVAFEFTGERKRDVSPKELFRLHEGGAADRAVIADYCVQDCALCNALLDKLQVVLNAVAMASTAFVPLSYIFLRGQGVKILSLVSYYSRKRGMLIQDLPRPRTELEEDAPAWKRRRQEREDRMAALDGPEEACDVQGAIVLEPTTGFYVDDPVSVCDYASLYPSSIMSHGISPDARVRDPRYLGLPGYRYVDVEYEVYEGKDAEKRVVGRETVTFAKRADEDVHAPDTMAIIPAVERILLQGRRGIREKAKHKRAVLRDGTVLVGALARLGGGRLSVGGREVDEAEVATLENAHGPFALAVLDGQQLSYKLLANSVYGQLGARTGDIRDAKLAACVTSVGRGLIMSAKAFIEEAGGTVVYGDTDSVFATFPVHDPRTGERLRGRAALPGVIARAREVAREFTATRLPAPHDLEYEKTFWPMLLLAKKKYVGNMYETDVERHSLKYMGVVLKRRDNAPVVRRVVKLYLDRLFGSLDIGAALGDTMAAVAAVARGEVDLQELVVTKTLRSEYKDRSKIAHAVLADRIAQRDPGNAPQSNDRVPMVHVRVADRHALQGDKVESPSHVLERGLEVDYEYYVESQIMNPLVQMVAPLVDALPEHANRKPEGYWAEAEAQLQRRYAAAALEAGRELADDALREKVRKDIDKQKHAEVRRVYFEPLLAQLRNRYARRTPYDDFGFFKRQRSQRLQSAPAAPHGGRQ